MRKLDIKRSRKLALFRQRRSNSQAYSRRRVRNVRRVICGLTYAGEKTKNEIARIAQKLTFDFSPSELQRLNFDGIMRRYVPNHIRRGYGSLAFA